MDLLQEAVAYDQFDIACKILELQPRHSFKDPNVPIYLQRCRFLTGAIAEHPPDSKKAKAKKKDLQVYKSHLEAIFKDTSTTTSPNKYEKTAIKNPSTLAEDALSLLECSICFEEMLDTSILSCNNDHWICRKCFEDGKVMECPVCRQDFKTNPAQKRYTVEKLACALKNLKDSLEN